MASPEITTAGLIVVKQDPFNAESPLTVQHGIITSTPQFYVRSHFAVPDIDVREWTLHIDGLVATSLKITFQDLLDIPPHRLRATLECAGNGRTAFQPECPGEPWQYGAVSTAEWTGAPLRALLERAGIADEARELVAEGADRGTVDVRGGPISFARSVPIKTALHPDTLLAYQMNGEPLTPAHGFPVRLLVPGWYGMASIKWLTRLTATSDVFDGYYQVDRYVLAYPGVSETTPLGRMAVRSVIVEPADGAVVDREETLIRGYAWSGSSPVERVDVSTDGGFSWHEASLTSAPEPYAWRSWERRWRPERPGEAIISSRARDAGSEQPSSAPWNQHGYANNAIQSVRVSVKGEQS